MPRIYQRRGLWWLDYRDERGERRREPARGADGRSLTNRANAERALHERLVDVHANRRDPWRRQGDGSRLLAEFLKEHEAEHVAQLADARTRRAQLASWREHFGARARLRDVTRAEVERFVARRLKEVRPATVQRDIAALSKAMSVAVERGLLPANPCAGVRPPKFDNRRTRYLDEDEEAKLLRECAAGVPWLLALVLLALDAGGRLEECRTVELRDVDHVAGIVTYRHTKARRIRHVHMTPRLAGALRAWFARGERWPGDHRGSFCRARERAGLGKDVTFHVLRHTFGTRLAASGVPLHVVQALLGHQSITMTMRYAHVADEQKRAAIASLVRGTNAAPATLVAPGIGGRDPS